MPRPDICLSIGNIEYDQIEQYLKEILLGEIRIDLLDITENQIESVFKSHSNLIATYRTENNDYRKMQAILEMAILSGCAYIDVDILIPEDWRNKIVKFAKDKKKKVILSYHNFDKTPNIKEINSIIDGMKHSGADITKVACMANSITDCSTIMGLYSMHSNLVAISMGEVGKITRLGGPLLGAPFTYASISKKQTAPGQIEYSEIEEFLNKYLPLT